MAPIGKTQSGIQPHLNRHCATAIPSTGFTHQPEQTISSAAINRCQRYENSEFRKSHILTRIYSSNEHLQNGERPTHSVEQLLKMNLNVSFTPILDPNIFKQYGGLQQYSV